MPTDRRGAFIVLIPARRCAEELAAPVHVAAVRRVVLDDRTEDQVATLRDITCTVLAGPTRARRVRRDSRRPDRHHDVAHTGGPMSQPQVTDSSSAHRYEIHSGGDVAGFAEYERDGGATSFTHTVVESRFEGQGIGSALARGALDAERAAGRNVLPYCPFIRSWIQKHPEYLELVPTGRREEFALAPSDPTPDQG